MGNWFFITIPEIGSGRISNLNKWSMQIAGKTPWKHCARIALVCCLGLCTISIYSDTDTEVAEDDNSFGVQLPISDNVGHPTFSSPHFNPVQVVGNLVYVVNTPADTLDVIDSATSSVVLRINTGIDPVSISVRPDGKEVWVANHISDTISVVNSDPESILYHQVVATIQDVNLDSLVTQFDEPVGIAFASNEKAYIALGPSNQIAVVDVAQRKVSKYLPVSAQDPRALVVRDGYLYVIVFESGNRTQLSGCYAQNIDDDICTYDAIQETHTTNNVLSLNYTADIVKNPKVPDRDLFIFNTETDILVDVVEGTGSLLYGLAVDSDRQVYIAQADARNAENGRAGTQQHGLEEMENRAFLNQITHVNCQTFPCGEPSFFELEPLPPVQPDSGMALATPFGIQVSFDNATIVATAAGSDKVFTMNAESGEILGRVSVDEVPRGIALISNTDGAAEQAWVLNAVANTVSLIDLTTLSSPMVTETIALVDPTPELMKKGRIAFNDADVSTTGTFSCDSCHPDNNVDQLLWVLDTPLCDHPGCEQIPPRLTMPVRGLRDTAPYHWDGIPGDPYGGINVSSLWESVDPNCSLDEPESCTRFLVDGSLGTTMCEVTNCSTNEEGKKGALDADTRDALAHYILNVPFPPAPARPFGNEMTASAKTGFFEFNYLNDSGLTTGAQACGACHKAPFLTSTNTPSSTNVNGDVGSFNGMDAPTWRGAYDRWIVTPQARFNVIDLIERIGMDLEGSLPEQTIWFHAGARTQANWDMVLEGSTGFSGSYARQATLDKNTANIESTTEILSALRDSANDGGVKLQAEGVFINAEEITPVALEFDDGLFVETGTENVSYTLDQLQTEAADGRLLLTFTGRIGENYGSNFPQPALWPYWTIGEDTFDGIVQQSPTVEMTFLSEELTLSLKGRHIQQDSILYLNGRSVDGTIKCADGELPSCDDEILTVTLDEAPESFGLNFMQVQTPDGLFSNDIMFYSEQVEKPDIPGNLIVSGGDFTNFEFPLQRFWNTVELDGNSITHGSGSIFATINRVNLLQPWRAQISHTVSVVAGQNYSLCYRARAFGTRTITAYLDRNMHGWQNLSGGQFTSSLNIGWQEFKHTFTVNQTDITARVAFDMAQSRSPVQLDDIGLYEGSECGSPDVTRGSD